MTLEENQPDYEDPSKQPKTLTKTRHIDNVLYVAGRAPREKTEYEIMFITTSVEEDEAMTHATSTFGFRVSQPAEYLKGANGVIKDVALMSGIDMEDCYYTAVCKWLLPRAQRARPSKKIMKWGMKIIEDEIARIKPKIIVCLGKPVFDLVGDQKINFKDAHGCWFWNEQHQAHMYVMHAPYTLVGNPEHYETFRIDFREIARRRDILRDGGKITGDDVTYQVINNEADLLDWLGHIEELASGGGWPGYDDDFSRQDTWPGLRDEEGNPILSVDCEWHGKTHVDGQLRTIQFAWSETEAVVIEFRNEKNEWSFELESVAPPEYWDDTDARNMYGEVGKPIASTFERMNARFIGHHFAADAPWMQHWLGIETYEKCVLDTEFAQQTCDESSELGLERGIAMKYTNLGRYDQSLVEWKRENKDLVSGGYGYVPSSILYPYGAKDVCTPYRAYPLIKRQLEAQRLWDYYKTIANPYCTDVFTEFAMVGLPMDIPMMDDLRNLFTWTTARLNKKLQERISTEANQKFKSTVMQEFGVMAVREMWLSIDESDEEGLKTAVKVLLNDKGRMQDVNKWNKMIHHLVESPRFNIRSPDQMARWLFDFEGLTPIKSTSQKAKGLPSMGWDKVLELPADRQALYKPAVDKQTLAILSDQLPAIDELLNLNAVGSIAKSFLNEPDIYIDEDTGEEVRDENGMHAWLCGDSRIHCQYSTTDTYRSRSWHPNTLNYPSYVNKRIAKTIEKCIREAHEEGDLPDTLMRWVGVDGEKLPSIRSCITAPDGMILVESDYATAEMVALSEIANDEDLKRLLKDPDPEWAKLKPDHWTGAKAVRVAFSDPKFTGIPVTARNPEFLMQVWVDGECLGSVSDDDLLHGADGNVVHAKYDIHWSLIERTYERYRETMKDKVDRNAAKVLNFSSAYGASANSLERKIESDTGVKPAEGTGDRGLEAIAERQPRATRFLEEMAKVPKEKGFYRAASGRIRHCPMHGAGSGVGWRTRNSIESALGRQLRNYPMQESVGATAARACKWLIHAYRRLGMKARVMTCLYDSVVTLCPLEERFLAGRLHQICMSEINGWDYSDESGDRTLRYSIDNEFNWRWSTRPSKEEQKMLGDPTFHPAGPKLNFLTNHPSLIDLAGLPRPVTFQ